MNKKIIQQSNIVRELCKRVPLEGGGEGFTTVSDGREQVFYTVELDLEQLPAMAHAAARNKTGVSRDGALTVRVVERRRL